MSGEPVKHTERSVLTLLRARHAPKRSGNGPEWAYMEKVRNAAGFAANRTADAMALGLWPSRGHELHGYEVKVSRSDWKSELNDPAKADAWHGLVDRWWMVAPKGVILKDELPATWGLLEVNTQGTKITQIVAAPLLTENRAEVSRSMLVCLLRAAGAGLEHTPDEAGLKAAYDEGYKKARELNEVVERSLENEVDSFRKQVQVFEDAMREVERALGVEFKIWRHQTSPDRIRQVGSALRAVLDSEERLKQARSAQEQAAIALERAAKLVRAQVISGAQYD